MRLELGLNQTQVAERTLLKQVIVSGIETGKRVYITEVESVKLARVLGYDTDELWKLAPKRVAPTPTTKRGKLIRARRLELGISLEVFARKMRMSPDSAEALELTKGNYLNYGLIRKLSRVLKLHMSVLCQFAPRAQRKSRTALGDFLRKRRKELVISNEEMSKMMGVTIQYMNRIEAGHARLSQNGKRILQLAHILDVEVSVLEELRPLRKMREVKMRNKLGLFLAQRRLKLHLTQTELGERVGKTYRDIAHIEEGYQLADWATLKQICVVLHCEVPCSLMEYVSDNRGVAHSLAA